MTRVLISGGLVVDGESTAPVRADVLIEGDRIVAVSVQHLTVGPDDAVIDATDRLVLPGFIDAHAHAEGAVFDPEVQLALLRQGITTVIGGQDGVSYAPGDGRYASEYFAAINGPHPTYRGSRVADLLRTYDGEIPLGVAYVVPAGTVRHEVMGADQRQATPDERARMVTLVREALDDGAVGLSTGLDYVPGIFADADEIAALCAPLADAGLPYVTHMRGGYEDNAEFGVDEVARIGRAAGVPVHISHFHTPADEAWRLMDRLAAEGVSATFDAYPYTRGCSILGMTMLPPEMNAAPVAETVAALGDPDVREHLRRDWFPRVARNPSLGPEWPDLVTLAHTAAEDWAWAHGRTLAEIADARGTDPIDAALDVLAAARLNANVVMAVRNQRPVADLGRLIAHPAHIGGSDGIFIGAHPHPRARGTFATYLATYVRDHAFLDWAEAVSHLSTRPADRFQLGARGRLRPGSIADIAIVDPERVRDTATYAEPTELAVGIDDVLVAGRPVLADGRLTGARPGGGIRADASHRRPLN